MKCYNCKASIPEGISKCPECGQTQEISRELIDAAIKGDQSALTDLYNRTYNSVFNTIRFMLKNEDAALDILQDSYIKAFASLEQLKEADKFEPWIKRIAHNKTIDHLRKSNPLPFSGMISADSDEAPEFEDDRPENLPEAVIDQRETARLINEILDSLPDDQRLCISMFYYDQLSVKEISSELDIPEATVKSRLQYGRKKIEAQVKALEKKGTKLYGIAPIPFLMLLFRQHKNVDEAASSVVLDNVIKETSTIKKMHDTASAKAAENISADSAKKAVGVTAKAAAKQAAVSTAKSAILTKVIAAVAAAAVVIGGGAVVIHNIQQPKQELQAIALPEPPAPEAEELPVPPEDVSPELPSAEIEESKPQTDTEAYTEPIQTAAEETRASSQEYDSWADAYQAILNGYQECMSEGIGGSSPYLQYEKVRYTLEARDGSRAIQYALYDINQDGTPELIFALDEYYEEGIEWWIPFEIYAFDRGSAVPVCLNILKDSETLHIGSDGTIWIDSGNSGFSTTTFYELSPQDNELHQTIFFDAVQGEDYYRCIIDGVESQTVSREQFWESYAPEAAPLEYMSILHIIDQ